MSVQPLVGAAGLGLVAANAATTQRAALTPLWSGSGDLAGAHTAAKQIGVECLAVGALVLIAGTSDGTGRGALAVIVCLWVLYLVHHRTTATTAANGTHGLRAV